MNKQTGKRLLMLNGSFNEIPLIEAAHRLGYYVITTGNDSEGEGHKYADEFCLADYSNIDSIVKVASDLRVDAICSAGNDLAALSASYAAEELGLNGQDTYQASKVFHEKDEFRRVASSMRLNVPKAAAFSDGDAAIR